MNKKVILAMIAVAAVSLTAIEVYKARHRQPSNEPASSATNLTKLGEDTLQAAHFENLAAAIKGAGEEIITLAECRDMYTDLYLISRIGMVKSGLSLYGGTKLPSDKEIDSVCSDQNRAQMVRRAFTEANNQKLAQ